MKSEYICALGYMLAVAAILTVPTPARPQGPQNYEACYLYLGDFPADDDDNGWNANIQGVTHDTEFWYFTQTDYIKKIHVSQDLSNPQIATNIPISRVQEFVGDDRYNHLGAPAYHGGYVAVPVVGYGNERNPPGIMVFLRSSDLSVAHWAELDPRNMPEAGWCAVDERGYLYSAGNTAVVCKYKIGDVDPADWNLGRFPADRHEWLQAENTITLVREDGVTPLEFPGGWHQGGAFSESGELFYFTCGMSGKWWDILIFPPPPDSIWHFRDDGISVFEVDQACPPDFCSWRRLRRSSLSDMPFAYMWEPGGTHCQEPEGLTVWDLDDGRAPYVSGQLHVLMYENGGEELFFKHYTWGIYVDRTYVGAPYYGRPERYYPDGDAHGPYKTVADAYAQAWDGQRIIVQAGTYPETLTLSKRIQVNAQGGLVQIGEAP